MTTKDAMIIDALGGTSAVAQLIDAATSTVHSWRTIGTPRTHRAHISLRASLQGKRVNWDTGEVTALEGVDHVGIDTTGERSASSGNGGEVSAPAVAA